MSAFLTATVTIKNPEKFQEYGQKASLTFPAYGAQVLIKGAFVVGDDSVIDHNSIAVISFPSLKHIEDWYESSDYQALIPLRDEGAEIIFSRYEVPK